MYKHCVCHEAEAYLQPVREMRRRYGVSDVFLATQDADVVAAFRREPGIRVMALDFDRQALTGRAALKALHWRQKLGFVDRQMVAESALVDLFLLSECDMLVGAFHSQFARLAYQLMAVRAGRLPPFASVDLSWGAALAYPL
mmetsp:Transcript_83080/g.222768  ORF Transcript_83080/g.222768 Transcript_83080/m.222768 type:complete len:142 (+) Transcript_83080:403-828(+)